MAKFKECHHCSQVLNRESNKYNVLHTKLYPWEVSEVMLTSNLWANVGLDNGAKGGFVGVFTTMNKAQEVETFLKSLLYNFVN